MALTTLTSASRGLRVIVLTSVAAGCGSLSAVVADGGPTGGGGGGAGSIVISVADAGGGGPTVDAGGTAVDANGPAVDAGGGGPGVDAGADADADTRVCAIKINEIQTAGATALDEFVELYNTCPDRAASLAGYMLVYRSSTGVTDSPRVTFTTQTIAAGHPYFVCANSGFSGAADLWYTDGLAADGGGLALRGPGGGIVDSVGWGTASNAFVEGTPAPAAPDGQSIARVPDGHDTDDNAADFATIPAPSPGAPN